MERLRAAKRALEGQLAASEPDEAGSGGGSEHAEVQVLRQEVEGLRHDNREMEAGFHEAAAGVGNPTSSSAPKRILAGQQSAGTAFAKMPVRGTSGSVVTAPCPTMSVLSRQ